MLVENDRRRRALYWVKLHRTGLSDAECQEIISEALLRTMPQILDQEVALAHADEAFRRVLGTHGMAAQRRVQRFTGIEELEGVYRQWELGDGMGEEISREYLLKLARTLKTYIAIAIDLLPSRAHDLIVREYHLLPLGFSIRDPRSMDLSDGVYRVALYRARKRFLQILETICASARSALEMEPGLVRVSLQGTKKFTAFQEPQPPDFLGDIELRRLVEATKGFISLAVDLLPDRDHDWIVEFYGLERFGLALRNPGNLFLPKHLEGKAVYRARQSFLRKFEAVLAAAQVTLEHDREIIAQTLRLIRGETIADTLEIIGELEVEGNR